MLGEEELSTEDRKTVNRARRLERFLTQPFHVTERFTGQEGRTVALEDTLDGCERILADEFSEAAERALYMIGGIDEAGGATEAREGGAGGARDGVGDAEEAVPEGGSEQPVGASAEEGP
jgi:F-type H+-transporting ATPase subunit beta